MKKLLILMILLSGCATFVADEPIDCRSCERWNQPFEPKQLGDDTWYVGVHGLASILITTDDGHILLDGGLPQSAPQIAQNIRALGFDLNDVAVIAVSHEHYDHAGGVASLQRASGARVVALAPQATSLQAGFPNPEDPQYRPDGTSFPAVTDVEIIDDGWVLLLGDIRLEAVATPGHSPGGTSWLWTDCIGEECYSFAYVDSLTPIAADGFRYSDGTDEVLRRTIERVANLDCEIFLAPHPERFGLHDEPDAGNEYSCEAYAESALVRLEERLEWERE